MFPICYHQTMMKVAISKEATKALARMPANTSRLVREKIAQYASAPDSLAANVTALRGRPGFRLRVGDWRVIFEVEDETMIVLDIGPRGSIY